MVAVPPGPNFGPPGPTRRLLLRAGTAWPWRWPAAAGLLAAAPGAAAPRNDQADHPAMAGPRDTAGHHDGLATGPHPGARHAGPDPRPLVMIDPGHGGKDPGAIGISGTYEKHVALATAHELHQLLQAGGRYRVALTRVRDVFVPLDDRVAHAQAQGAALFVSMHADAIADHTVRGASVYTLATSASDAQTAALAQRENSADRFAGGAFRDQPAEVAAILASLVRQETRAGSAAMAHRVVGALRPDIGLLSNPSRHAAFVVLQAADIPSVLVEMGFMSNPADEAALRRADHRLLVAAAMKRAVDSYFATAAPMVRMAG